MNASIYVSLPSSLGRPAASLLDLSEKRSSACLVIPVINEGDRIIRQLESIAQIYGGTGAEPHRVDVIIADGGSSDGSLDPERLKALGVRAVIRKDGPGKQGAQFRAGLGWALDQGYEHFITMDGNGKDGVEGIEAILSRVEAGYDYVQGSRYARGGKAVNTPIFRKMLGRFVHAPVCSLSSGVWLTDTTNGFRGYSRRLVSSDDLSLFRDCFLGYEFLFYISCRAPRFGMKTCEVGVSRSYPSAGKTPTKMKGVRAKIMVFVELFKAASSGYDPKRTRS